LIHDTANAELLLTKLDTPIRSFVMGALEDDERRLLQDGNFESKTVFGILKRVGSRVFVCMGLKREKLGSFTIETEEVRLFARLPNRSGLHIRHKGKILT
jgi:hypothetical protein